MWIVHFHSFPVQTGSVLVETILLEMRERDRNTKFCQRFYQEEKWHRWAQFEFPSFRGISGTLTPCQAVCQDLEGQRHRRYFPSSEGLQSDVRKRQKLRSSKGSQGRLLWEVTTKLSSKRHFRSWLSQEEEEQMFQEEGAVSGDGSEAVQRRTSM